MSFFVFRGGELCAEEVALTSIAESYGTPCYVYSSAALTEAFRQFDQGFSAYDHLICYAVKANSNLSVLSTFARLGAGFDIVSGGELARVLAAGGDPGKIVFSGIGKTSAEMREALAIGILCFNVESESELVRLNQVAGELGKMAPVSIRVNPDVDAKTHPYISTGLKDNKFGVSYESAYGMYLKAAAMPNISVRGVDCHIGSQVTEIEPFIAALDRVLVLVDQLQDAGMVISHLDLGGGVGIRYRDENPPEIAHYAQALLARLAGRNFKLLLEPGRALVGNAGVLLTRVEYIKSGESKNFAIVDAAMNDLMRPALYDAWHDIIAVEPRIGASEKFEVVGPVCESGDFLGHDRALCIEQGDLLAVMSAGAYGMSMSSNYNSRPRAAEVMVNRSQIKLVRERESIVGLFAQEQFK
jgi:diaminopimelate decarboxylase